MLSYLSSSETPSGSAMLDMDAVPVEVFIACLLLFYTCSYPEVSPIEQVRQYARY